MTYVKKDVLHLADVFDQLKNISRVLRIRSMSIFPAVRLQC